MDDLLECFNNSALAQSMGMTVQELERGRARVSLTLRPEFTNWFGMLHGGVIMTLADHAFGCATNSLDGNWVAVEFNIHFLASAPREGQLYADAEVEHSGRRLGRARMVVTDEREKVIARASGLVMAVEK